MPRGSKPGNAVRVNEKPTLASQGIDKNLAQQARVKLSDEGFEEAVTEARANVAHRFRQINLRTRERRRSFVCKIDDALFNILLNGWASLFPSLQTGVRIICATFQRDILPRHF
jgi:hypothetical protein